MDTIITFIKKHYFIVAVFAFIILLRFIWIDTFPPGMQYDEIEYSLSSKTFQMFATDLSGVGFPSSLITTKTLGKVSPIPYMILAPFWTVFDLNMTTFRSLYVILNIITSFVFMALLHQLFKNKQIAFLGGILFLLNPWSYFLSRHGMDGSFALLFYLIGTVFLLREYSKKNIITAFVFFILGCFSYHGAKLPLVPIVTVISLYKIVTEKKKGKQLIPYAALIASLAVIVAAFVFGGRLLPGSILNQREHEFVFTNAEKFAPDVNITRTNSITSSIHNVMINKYIYAGQYFIGNYLKAFDSTLLFLKGEVLEIHGMFYIFDAVLLIAGFVALFHQKQKLFWLIAGLSAVAPISTATSLSGFSIINRAIYLLPMLVVFITYGLYVLYKEGKKYIPSRILFSAISLLYIAAFLYFHYVYYFILPIQINMHYQTNTRVLAKYISLEKKVAPKIIIIASKPQVLFSGLVFYLAKEEQEQILKQKQTFGTNSEFTIGNVFITDKCIDSFNSEYTYIIDHDKEPCYKKMPWGNFIVNQIDAAVDFTLVNDISCTQYPLTRWHAPHIRSDFKIESMNEQEFCTRWIATPDNPKPTDEELQAISQ